MPPKDKIKNITFAEDAHIELSKGVELMRKGVGSTYGPGGRNVLIQKPYVPPVLTRDGVTVARDIAGHGNRLSSRIASEAAKLVYQASEKTNKTAGDGTTMTVVLLGDVYKRGRQRIVAGEDAMVVKRQLDSERETIIKFIESKSMECDKNKLKQVATISAGDEALGALVADLVNNVGADGSINLTYHNAPAIQVEEVTGYLFDSGFRFLTNEIELDAPNIFVTQKRMSAKGDIIPLLSIMEQLQQPFIIVGDVTGAAMETLVWAVQNQRVDGVAIPPPAFGSDGHEYFEDIATYVGSRLWLESDDFKQVTAEDMGRIERARLSRERSILFNSQRQEAVNDRIEQIKTQMKDSQVTPSLMEVLVTRRAKLAGKVSIIKIGAATEVEREELFFRIEDAVEACKSALSSGVVAGGATTLLFAAHSTKLGDATETQLSTSTKQALQAPFRLLMENAAEDGGYRLGQVLESGYGKGFNLRDMTEKPTDLLKAGIVDPTKVIVQAVSNAFSVAGALLTTGATITQEPDADESAKQA